MCVIALAYKTPALGPLVLVANRDETYARATAPLDRWPTGTETLGGRDDVSGGSWLLVDARGRFAAVTNIRDGRPVQAARSRGELVVRFVTGDASALDFARTLAAKHDQYAPFNLLFGQVDDLFHFHSRTQRLTRLTPGVHTLSNATLDTPWFKSERLAAHLRTARRLPGERDAYDWLADPTPAAPEQLPNTGVGLALEKMLSPVFIRGRDYGTRASMLLTVSTRGDILFCERSYGLAGRPTGDRRFSLRPAPVPRRIP